MPIDNKTRNKNIIRGLPFFFSTRFFIILAVMSGAFFVLYFQVPVTFTMLVIANAILLLAAVVDLFLPPRTRNIELRRPLLYPLAVDRPNDINIEIINRTDRMVSLIVKDDIPLRTNAKPHPITTRYLYPGERRLTYKLIPPERGDHEFGNINFWVKGMLGLVWKRGQANEATTIKIYPGLAAIEETKLGVRRPATGDISRAYFRRGVGTEFDSLRDYINGDDTRLIHWPSSARKGLPVVRQNRVERSQNVFLVIDAGRMMTARVKGKTKMDYSLTAALLTAYAALELGDKVGALVVARDVMSFQPLARGQSQFGRILDATYALEPRMEEPRFHLALSLLASRLKRRSLVIIFTDLIDQRASEGLLRYSLGLRPRHLPLLVAMSDTEVVNLADSTPHTEQDLYRQGIAADILDRREHLLAKLTSVGVMVMDVPPDKLSTSVLDQYLEIKTRNLL